jgi:hypothetical protein
VPHLLTVLVLATSPSPSPSGSGAVVPPDDTVSPGLLGFLSFLFLGIAVFLIARGLNKQLKRVSFDEDAVNADGAVAMTAPDAGESGTSSDSPATHDEADPTPRNPSGAEPAPDAEQKQV